jgi:hypothetical protein
MEKSRIFLSMALSFHISKGKTRSFIAQRAKQDAQF